MIDFEDVDFGQRRKYVRRPVRLEARLNVKGRELTALTENISPGGAFFEVELPPDVKDLVASIHLPNGKEMAVKARVCWRRPSPSGVGVSFEQFLRGEPEKDLPH